MEQQQEINNSIIINDQTVYHQIKEIEPNRSNIIIHNDNYYWG